MAYDVRDNCQTSKKFEITGGERKVSAFDQLPIIEDPEESRCPCLLLLDVSYSMGTEGRIEQLNRGIKQFADELGNDSLASKRVEIAIVTFGGTVEIQQDFVSARDFRPEELEVSGATPMGEAINVCLDLLETRKKIYKNSGVTYYRPWVFVLTDGGPTDDWQGAAARMKNGEDAKKFTVFGIGVSGADLNVLQALSSRKPAPLNGTKFAEFFSWLSSSLATASASEPGAKVDLADSSDWMSADV